MKSLGDVIRQKRKAKKLTLDQLSNRIDCSKSFLSKLERDLIEEPRSNILRKVAQELDTDYNELLMHSNYVDKQSFSSPILTGSYYELDKILENPESVIVAKGKIVEKKDREKLLKMMELLLDLE